jgi:hypothetical protein
VTIRNGFSKPLNVPLRTHRSPLLISATIGLAVFFLALALGVPVEEYDGGERRKVAAAFWRGEFATTWFDVGAILSLVPFFAVGSLVHWLSPDNWSTANAAILIHSSFFVAATAALMAYWLARNTRKIGHPAFGTLVIITAVSFANPILYTNERYLIETPLAAYLTAFFVIYDRHQAQEYSFRQWSAAAMVGISMLAVLTRGPSALFFVPFLVMSYCRRDRGTWIALVSGLALGTVGTGYWNFVRTGDVLATPYGLLHFTPSQFLEALYAASLSPGMGIIFFCPLAAIGIGFAVSRLRSSHHSPGLLPVVIGSAAFAGSFLTWWSYHGGLSYGPRFLLPVLPLFAMFGVQYFLSRPVTPPRVLGAVLVIAWGMLVNATSMLLPIYETFYQWHGAVDNWRLPARETRFHIEPADRLQLFDPAFSHLTGSLNTLFRRSDLWELPVLRFGERRVSTLITLRDKPPSRSIDIIARGHQPYAWTVVDLRVRNRFTREDIPITLDCDHTFINCQAALDRNRETFAQSTPIRSGQHLRISFNEIPSGPVQIELAHGRFLHDIPQSLVLQQSGGNYFGGSFHDPSYIDFDRTYKTRSPLVGIAPLRLGLLAAGLILLFKLASRWCGPRHQCGGER